MVGLDAVGHLWNTRQIAVARAAPQQRPRSLAMRKLLLMLKRLVIAALLALAPGMASAAPSTCQEQFAAETPPTLLNSKLAARTTALCFTGFATLYSGATRTPLYSAEHLTRERLLAAKDMKRENAFHEERGLPAADRSVLADYARSGLDRGHMAPSGDMPDRQSQYESFSLANMIPQNSDNNRRLWEGIERAVRDLVLEEGEAYVVTGPIFQGATLQSLHSRVVIPTGIFKAIYDPRRNAAAAYVVNNAPGMEWKAVSAAELQNLVGIDVFPALPADIKGRAMPLPRPMPYGHRK
jgi:endonuclease G